MNELETENGKIAYWKTSGDETKPVLVFLHGLSSNHTTWLPIIDRVKRDGYPTLSVDLRGHGYSDKTRKRSLYNFVTMRKDLEKIIKKEGITNFCLIGYSYGGYVAMDFMSANPDSARAVVLISANYVSPFDYHWYKFLTPIARVCVNLFGWLLLWQKRRAYYYFDPDRAQGYWKSTFSGYATMPLSINFWMLSEVFVLNYKNKLKQVSSPILIIRGENDTFITAKEIADLSKELKHSKVITLGLGHYVASHYQELVAENTLQFIESLS